MSAFGPDVFNETVMVRLKAVAHALNAGEIALAMTSAVLLKFPEPHWGGAARLARADALLKYNPDEPRDWHGRWTTGAGGAATKPRVQFLSSPLNNEVQNFLDHVDQHDVIFGQGQDASGKDINEDPFALPPDFVHLPDGDRIDELGDLLETIANARPGEASSVADDIDRQFLQNGDIDGYLKLTGALLDITRKANPTTADRQAILDEYEYLTHTDPRETGRANIDAAAQLVQLGLVPGGGPPDEPSGPEEEPVDSDPNQPSEDWEKGWAQRGKDLERKLGGPEDLPENSPVIDRFPNGIATSWKSLDLRGNTYQNPAVLMNRLNRYVDKVRDFNGMSWRGKTILKEEINGRSLNIVFPKGSMTAAQRNVINAAKARANSFGVGFKIFED